MGKRQGSSQLPITHYPLPITYYLLPKKMSGIYKSRLFNFLNRQRIRFSNQLGITLRHIQLATETGVQILLYPVYIIARTSISARQQLGSDSQSSVTQVKISRKKILTEDDLWWSDEENNLTNDIHKTDSLAMITANQKVASGLSRPRQDEAQVIAPIRFFQKMLDWVKTSPVATKFNLFEEANIVTSSPVNSLTDASSSLKSLNSSQREHISDTESSEQESFTIQILIRRAIAYFFGDKQQLLSDKNQETLPGLHSQAIGKIQRYQANFPVTNSAQLTESKFSLMSQVSSWIEKVKSTIVRPHGLTTESSEQESFAIQVLIRRAIAYFFGNKKQLLSGKNQEALPSAESAKLLMSSLSLGDFLIINNTQKQKPKSSLFSKLDSWLNKSRVADLHNKSLTTISSAEDSLSIQILIHRAIAYFFGNKQVIVSNQLQGRFCATLPFSSFNFPVESKKLPFTLPFETWNLKLSDVKKNYFCLPDYSLFQANILAVIETDLPKLEASDINIDWRQLLALNNVSSEIDQNPSCIVITANFPPTLITGEASITVTSNSNDSLLANIPLEFSSDLWEAEVITIGYAKNILEIILEFLDKITWWIEKQFVKLWQFFQKTCKQLIITNK